MVKCEPANVCFRKKVFLFPIRAFQVTQRSVARGTAAKEADKWAAVSGVLLSMLMDASRMDVDYMLVTLQTVGS